jgi:hypothetical protein
MPAAVLVIASIPLTTCLGLNPATAKLTCSCLFFKSSAALPRSLYPVLIAETAFP